MMSATLTPMTDTQTPKSRKPRYTGPIDFAAVQPEPEAVKIARASNVDLTAFREVIAASASRIDDKGRGVVIGLNVTAEAAPTAMARFRQAAREAGHGVTMGTIPFGDSRVLPDYNLTEGQVRLQVQVKPKKAAKAAKKTAPTPQSTGLPPVSGTRKRR